jgi:endo-1,4-beta-D-glucanase Y
MKNIYLLALLAIFSSKLFGQLYPFPQHISYATGTIKPNTFTQIQLDNEVKSFYDKWKARYLKQGCDTAQYYIWYNDLGYDGNELCVSEGHGYGMVIEAMMAGYDNAAKRYFDGLYRWYKAHPSSVNPLLMNWRQRKKDCASDGDDSATDGDEDIAFGLLLADKQWGSNGAINYLAEAKKIIDAVMQSEVYTQASYATQLGDWSHTSSTYKDGTRPSDFMLDHYRPFKDATGDKNWKKVLNECYSLIDVIQTNFSSTSGLMPDFIQHTDGSPIPVAANYLEGKWDGNYNYNSCRTPWRIGCDYLLNADSRSKTASDKINAWIKTAANNDPHNIHSGYYLNGDPLPNSNYEDLSFIAPFGVSAMVNASNQSWLNALWSYIIGVANLKRDGYYGNTIKMQCMIIMSGNWWTPNIVTTPVTGTVQPKQEKYPAAEW